MISARLSRGRHSRRKRSGRSRLQRWVRHAAARQSSTLQIAAIEPDESLHGLFDSVSEHSDVPSECESSDPAAEVLMAGSHHSPPGFGRGGGGGDGPSTDEYYPQPLTTQQSEDLQRQEQVLQTSIVSTTAETQALETVRLATLAERTRLEEMQKSFDERTHRQYPDSSRRQRQLFPIESNNEFQVFHTPVQNVAVAARIADSIQPSGSEAERGIEQIQALLRAAGEQNSAVSLSRHRIHSMPPRAETV